MELMASFHHSRLCWSRWAVVLWQYSRLSPVMGIQEGTIKTLTLLIPTQYVVVSATAWNRSFGHFDKGTAEVLISLLNIAGARKCSALLGFIGEEAAVIPVSLAEVPLLHQLTRYWGHKFCSSDERGSMLRPRELVKHKSVRKPVVWSSTRKGQIRIDSGVLATRSETDCTLWIMEQH